MKKPKVRLIIFGTLTIILIAVAIFAPYIATHDPHKAILAAANQPPSAENYFGTDKMGRDLFSRVIYGARTSIATTAVLVAIVFSVGGTLGIVAGYLGGKVDTVIMAFADILVSFPGMTLAIAMAGILGASLTNAVIAVAVVTWTKYARLARSIVLQTRNMDYIHAAKLAGSGKLTIMYRYFIPAVFPTLIVTAMADMGGLLLALAGFSFLGLGATSSSIEWGYMLNEGRDAMTSNTWLMLYPGLAIFITVVIFNLLGDSIRDTLDPTNNT